VRARFPEEEGMEYQAKFTWVENDEPHATRRKLILAKYPQITKLFKSEIRTCPIVVAIVVSQVLMAAYVQRSSWWIFWLLAYVYGGTANHSLQLAIHELSHNLCFRSLSANKVLAIFANLVTGIPSAIVFQKYHVEHHQFQGADGIDADIPSSLEVRVFTNPLLKVIWLVCQPLFYGIRPLMVRPKPPGLWELLNASCVFGFDILVYYFIGGRALAYLIAGTFLGMGAHPVAGHFVAEHYQLTPGQETYSYYGILNCVNFNVGYHNEHHDFPRIPWSNLPKVREIAPEFYKIPHYTSYVAVMWRYVMDSKIGPFSRIKRQAPKKSASKKKL